ncbi:MAG: penicillin-binding transpeptidase domain-containing protein [Holophagaceae bacterium]|nr:penicillin-binding transpeptidase domain-containing protein [Holophagaceae bacterium]
MLSLVMVCKRYRLLELMMLLMLAFVQYFGGTNLYKGYAEKSYMEQTRRSPSEPTGILDLVLDSTNGNEKLKELLKNKPAIAMQLIDNKLKDHDPWSQKYSELQGLRKIWELRHPTLPGFEAWVGEIVSRINEVRVMNINKVVNMPTLKNIMVPKRSEDEASKLSGKYTGIGTNDASLQHLLQTERTLLSEHDLFGLLEIRFASDKELPITLNSKIRALNKANSTLITIIISFVIIWASQLLYSLSTNSFSNTHLRHQLIVPSMMVLTSVAAITLFFFTDPLLAYTSIADHFCDCVFQGAVTFVIITVICGLSSRFAPKLAFKSKFRSFAAPIFAYRWLWLPTTAIVLTMIFGVYSKFNTGLELRSPINLLALITLVFIFSYFADNWKFRYHFFLVVGCGTLVYLYKDFGPGLVLFFTAYAMWAAACLERNLSKVWKIFRRLWIIFSFKITPLETKYGTKRNGFARFYLRVRNWWDSTRRVTFLESKLLWAILLLPIVLTSFYFQRSCRKLPDKLPIPIHRFANYSSPSGLIELQNRLALRGNMWRDPWGAHPKYDNDGNPGIYAFSHDGEQDWNWRNPTIQAALHWKKSVEHAATLQRKMATQLRKKAAKTAKNGDDELQKQADELRKQADGLEKAAGASVLMPMHLRAFVNEPELDIRLDETGRYQIPVNIVKRWWSFDFDPWDYHAVRNNYQIAHSLWAFSTGGLKGAWLDASPGSVPVGTSDLILAAVAEVFGLGGVLLVIGTTGFLVFLLWDAAARKRNSIAGYMLLGGGCYVFFQSAIIMCGTLNLVPLTGIPLTFLSAGRASLISAFAMMAFCMTAASQSELHCKYLSATFRPPIGYSALVKGSRRRGIRKSLRWLLLVLLIPACGAVWLTFVRPDEIAGRAVFVRTTGGAYQFDINPRFKPLQDLIVRGTVQDRNGFPLVTSRYVEDVALYLENEALVADLHGYFDPEAKVSDDEMGRFWPLGSLVYQSLLPIRGVEKRVELKFNNKSNERTEEEIRKKEQRLASDERTYERLADLALRGYGEYKTDAAGLTVRTRLERPVEVGGKLVMEPYALLAEPDLTGMIPALRSRREYAKTGQGALATLIDKERDIQVTIDIWYQKAVREALSSVMGTNFTSGAACVIDVATGELLASVSLPSYTPNMSDEEKWKEPERLATVLRNKMSQSAILRGGILLAALKEASATSAGTEDGKYARVGKTLDAKALARALEEKVLTNKEIEELRVYPVLDTNSLQRAVKEGRIKKHQSESLAVCKILSTDVMEQAINNEKITTEKQTRVDIDNVKRRLRILEVENIEVLEIGSQPTRLAETIMGTISGRVMGQDKLVRESIKRLIESISESIQVSMNNAKRKGTTDRVIANINVDKDGAINRTLVNVIREDANSNNRTNAPYPPGSTFKLLTAAAALNDGKIVGSSQKFNPNKFYCEGTTTDTALIQKWGKPVSCDGGHSHGEVYGIADAIKRSCNVYFAYLGTEIVGADRLRNTLESFNLNPTVSKELAQVSIGQTITQTPIDMARVVAIIANGGRGPKIPLLIHKLPGANNDAGRIVTGQDSLKDEVNEIVPMDSATAKLLRDGMWGATNNTGGTASKINWAVPVWGKTGTAQVIAESTHSWFVGFADRDSKDKESYEKKLKETGRGSGIAFAFLIENGGYGSDRAAPAASNFLKKYKEDKRLNHAQGRQAAEVKK